MSLVVGPQKKKRITCKSEKAKDKNEELMANKAKRERNYKNRILKKY